ncbi:hypothetical protein VTN96DRAFT_1669 [Rasamsonia emersonii]
MILLIQFDSLPLLNDTVTELIVADQSVWPDEQRLPMMLAELLAQEGNSLARPGGSFVYKIREDPLRVRYPPYPDDSPLPSVSLSDLQIKQQIADSAHLVLQHGCDRLYVYKTVNRPFYHPHDTETFEQELRNVLLFRGSPNIVQFVAVVKAPSPFATRPQAKNPDVIHGMLLEYYPGGTLEEAICPDNRRESTWMHWPKQIAMVLYQLHKNEITHMDITPKNVVIDAENNAVLIDIGVGFTHEWLAPEIREELQPLGLPFEKRRRHDLWAFGKLLRGLGRLDENGPFGRKLQQIGDDLSKDDPVSRIDLPTVIIALENS